MSKVLITGASGAIGQLLVKLLTAKRYSINTIGRNYLTNAPSHFQWNLETNTIDEEALEGVETIIHLAGAGIADKPWTSARKQEIIESRIKSMKLIFDTLYNTPHSVKSFISASAVGYYGDCGSSIISEEHSPASTFLANVCVEWEKAVDKMTELGIRVVKNRIGIVLSPKDGALPELIKTIPFGIAGYFAKEPLYYPWIHVDDVCGIFIHALENGNMVGAYNCTAPNPIPNKELIKEILKAMNSKSILAPIPTFLLKLSLGEMADVLLYSQNCSADKILKAGFKFKYPELESALMDCFKS